MSDRPLISPDATIRARRARKRREVALMLPLMGIALYFSPLLDALGFGDRPLPARFAAIFIGWAALIAGAYFLSRFLKPDIGRE